MAGVARKAARPVLWKGGSGGGPEAEGRGTPCTPCGADKQLPGASGGVGPALPVGLSQSGSAAPSTSRSDPLLGSASSSSRNCTHRGW